MLLQKGPERVLVVSDLHIGWELALTEKGIHVPSQTSKMLDKMLQLIKAQRLTSLIFLGDVKHTIATAEWGEWRDVPDFFEASRVPQPHNGSCSSNCCFSRSHGFQNVAAGVG